MASRKFVGLALSAMLLIGGVTNASGATRPAIGNTLVNSYTTNSQVAAAVGRQSDGSFIVVWNSYGQDGDRWGVFARRYDPSGTALGSEFQVNTYTTHDQAGGAIAMDANDGFVIAWRGFGPTVDTRVSARAFDAQGTPLGDQFAAGKGPNIFGQSFPNRVDIAGDGAGKFVAVWETKLGTPDDPDIFAQRFEATGNTVGPAFAVNTYTTDEQFAPEVVFGAGGGFFVVWQHITPGGHLPNQNVRARAFSSTGVALGPDFDVGGGEVGQFPGSTVAALGSGNYVVAWVNVRLPSPSGGLKARVYSPAGVALTSEFRIPSDPQDGGTYPALAPVAGGDFIVAWRSTTAAGGDASSINARRMSETGVGIGPQVRARNTISARGFLPTLGSANLSANDKGSFVVAWTDRQYTFSPPGSIVDTSGSAAFFTRNCDDSDPSCELCPGFDSVADLDGDSIPDGCDVCTNLAGARDMTRAKVKVRRASFPTCRGSGEQCRGDSVRVSGRFEVDLPLSILAPETTGIRVVIAGQTGGRLFDISLARGVYGGRGTRGWTVLKPGKWRYLDATDDPVNGVRKVMIRGDGADSGATRLRVGLKALAGFYPSRAELIPLALRFRVDGFDRSLTTVCGEKQ